jgi:hypothetical protein
MADGCPRHAHRPIHSAPWLLVWHQRHNRGFWQTEFTEMGSSFRYRLTVYRITMQNGPKWEIQVAKTSSYPLARWVGRPLTAPRFTHIPPFSKAPSAAFYAVDFSALLDVSFENTVLPSCSP